MHGKAKLKIGFVGDGTDEGEEVDATIKTMSNWPMRFGFDGMEWDVETQTNHADEREYDPVSGTFTSQDPIQADESTYRWGHDDPVNEEDPWGLGSVHYNPASTSIDSSVDGSFYMTPGVMDRVAAIYPGTDPNYLATPTSD